MPTGLRLEKDAFSYYSVSLSLPRATDTVGCVFMALALMRELTVVISLGWLRGLMSIFTASKTEVHNFQQRPVCYCEIIQKVGFYLQPIFKSSLWRRFFVSET